MARRGLSLSASKCRRQWQDRGHPRQHIVPFGQYFAPGNGEIIAGQLAYGHENTKERERIARFMGAPPGLNVSPLTTMVPANLAVN
jgi:hypothetical protein